MKKTKKPLDKPNVLVFDIETAPILARVWGLWKQNIGLSQIESDWHVLAFAAKWLDEKEVIYQDQSKVKNKEDDKKLLKAIWKLLDKADVVITHNGDNFDIPKLYARFILSGMQPPSSFKSIDTCKIAKKKFCFTSNKLEFLTDKLCKEYKKMTHKNFPGFLLWKECLKDNPKAWKEMKTYNKFDVLSLEELYKVLRSWDHNGVNFNWYSDDETIRCQCGSIELRKRGFAYTAVSKFQRYRCMKCGAEVRSRENLFSNEKKRSLKVRIK